MKLVYFASVLAFVVWQDVALGDVYMHNPRGSNNRLNGAGTARANALRLFDSQVSENVVVFQKRTGELKCGSFSKTGLENFTGLTAPFQASYTVIVLRSGTL